jgi:hypothetical protein
MKIFRAIVLLVMGFIWIAGCSSTLLNELYRTELVPDDYRYGDLYRLSNLAEFKDPKIKCPPYPAGPRQGSKKIALYIIGDSFTEEQRMGPEDFAVDKYQFTHWATQLHLDLDTSYTNIIILESVERKVREHFISPINNIIPDTATYISQPEDNRLVSQLDRLFSSAPTEDRLSTILFQFDPMLKLKEWKSWINLHFFDRTDPKVTVSEDGENLIYYETSDSTLITSSFNTVSPAEVDSLVAIINYDKKYLESLGFDQVWFSMIPNKASILMPDYGTYNHLIERISAHPGLTVDEISVFEDFKRLGKSPYLKGDSHWSCAGQYLWLEKVNGKIRALLTEKKVSVNGTNP